MFGGRLSWNEAVQRQGIHCESDAGRTRFCVVKFAVPEGVTDVSENYYVVRGRVHVDYHRGKEEDVSNCVIVIVCIA